MARFRIFLPISTGLLLTLFYPHASYAASGIIQTIIPQTGTCVCPGSAPDWGCVLQVIQTIINDAVALGVILCVVWLAYGGFRLMTSGGSPEARSEAKTRLLNAVIGIAVILCSWLIVDFVMKTIYNPSTALENGTFGPWNSILASNGIDFCLQPTKPSALTSGTVGVQYTGVNDTGGSLTVGGGGACDASNVQKAAATGGYQLTNQQANTFGCIAKYESNCGVKNLNYNWNNGSSAAGAFQVLLSQNSDCYNNSVCSQAAGVTGNLNCASGFNKGNPYPPGNQTAVNCVRAAANLSCSATAAACLLKKNNGSFSAWTTDSHSSGQASCISSN